MLVLLSRKQYKAKRKIGSPFILQQLLSKINNRKIWTHMGRLLVCLAGLWKGCERCIIRQARTEARARVPLPLSSRIHRNLASLISVQTPATEADRLPACKHLIAIVRNFDVLPRANSNSLNYCLSPWQFITPNGTYLLMIVYTWEFLKTYC